MNAQALPTHRLISDLLRLLLDGETAEARARLPALAHDADNLCGQLERSRLAGHFYLMARDLPLETCLPPAGIAMLASAAEQQLVRARRCRALLDLVGQKLSRAGIPFLTLKGLSLAQRFFGGVDRRFMWDVDILVQPPALDAAVRALADAGLHPAAGAQLNPRSRLWGIHAIEVRGEAGAVDIHHTLRRLPGIRFDIDPFWENAQAFSVDGKAYRTLSDLDTLLTVAVGLGTDIQTGHHNLRKIWDLYRILRALDTDTDWEAFLARREREGSQKLVLNVLAFCLLLLDAHTDCPRLAQALQGQNGQLLVVNEDHARAVFSRPRQHLGNRLLFSRLLPTPLPRYWLGWSLTLPARVWHYRKPRKAPPSRMIHYRTDGRTDD